MSESSRYKPKYSLEDMNKFIEERNLKNARLSSRLQTMQSSLYKLMEKVMNSMKDKQTDETVMLTLHERECLLELKKGFAMYTEAVNGLMNFAKSKPKMENWIDDFKIEIQLLLENSRIKKENIETMYSALREMKKSMEVEHSFDEDED